MREETGAIKRQPGINQKNREMGIDETARVCYNQSRAKRVCARAARAFDKIRYGCVILQWRFQ